MIGAKLVPRPEYEKGARHEVDELTVRRKRPNEPGMLLITERFYLWNLVKAGMFMKLKELTA